ncbi:MAG: hypothetical protein DCF15_14215 [Phormidesmis priestleyi]|uniref:Cofactor assembly of complex C subunit B n=1 Tax=Phormidesmis priestleyi TaxID=268141 RepID=A0A2W4X4T3_9CYAN|nr:MAG: hypothetical protein DCF15_14215 [Phormidesmis priestleyi]
MVIGLGFFIRASTKDRIEIARFGSKQSAEALEQAVMKYFRARAYQPESVPSEGMAATTNSGSVTSAASASSDQTHQTKLVGIVSPSVFMAVFLSALAAVGFGCLALIMVTIFPAWGSVLFGLVLASPLAGVFYWRKSSRPETVVIKIEPIESVPAILSTDSKTEPNAEMDSADSQGFLSQISIQGHRDEIADLYNAFSQPDIKAWAGLEKRES